MCNEKNNQNKQTCEVDNQKNTKFTKVQAFISFAILCFTTYSAIPDFFAANEMFLGKKDKSVYQHEHVIEEIDYTYNDKLINQYYVTGDVQLIVKHSKDAYTCYNEKTNQAVLKKILHSTVNNAVEEGTKETTYSYFGNFVESKLDIQVIEDKLKEGTCYDNATVQVNNKEATLYKLYK